LRPGRRGCGRADRTNWQLARPGNAEDLLGHDRAGEDRRNSEGDQGHHRDEAVAENVADHDEPLGDAFAQPNYVCCTEIFAERGFRLAAIESRISNLAFLIEKALFRGEHGARAIYIDASTLENHVAPAELSAEQFHFQFACGAFGNCIVLFPIRITSPSVKTKAGDCNLRVGPFTFNKNRAEIPRPASIGRKSQKLDSAHADASGL